MTAATPGMPPGTVLIVEDEPLVGLFLVDVLEDLDQRVIGADAFNEVVAFNRALCRDLAFLPKPYAAEQLGSTIRALLQRQA